MSSFTRANKRQETAHVNLETRAQAATRHRRDYFYTHSYSFASLKIQLSNNLPRQPDSAVCLSRLLYVYFLRTFFLILRRHAEAETLWRAGDSSD